MRISKILSQWGLSAFRSWWFDPFVATVSFAVLINWYWSHERRQKASSVDSFTETIGLQLGPLYSSLVAYWIGILLWTSVVPPASLDIPDGTPTNLAEAMYLCTEVVTGIVLYDGIFFCIHWAMHDLKPLRRFHKRHHHVQNHRVPVESRDVLRHSLVDGTLQVLVNILVQRHTPWGMVKTRLARALHNVLVIWMLCESHSAATTPYIWRRYFVGVKNHYEHHAGQNHRYQQFFGYLDDWRERELCKKRL